jgi:Predicted methyltransferase
VRGKRVIELGAGTGFLSLYCAKYLNVESVLVTDCEPALITNIQDCVGRNELEGVRLWPAIWEWGSNLEEARKNQEPEELWYFDVALGTDLVRGSLLVPCICH